MQSARPGQIVVELGSHLIPDKERQIAPLAAKGAAFLDGEVGGTPGMVSARKAVIYLAGDAEAAKKVEPVIRGFTDVYHYFGPFGSASKVKLINNLLVAVHMAATGEAMALALKTGVDIDLLIKAVAAGSGGSTQFGIRAPMMAQERFLPAMGNRRHHLALLRPDRRPRRSRRRRDAHARSRGGTLCALYRHGSRRARQCRHGRGDRQMPRARKRAKTKAKAKAKVRKKSKKVKAKAKPRRRKR